MIDVVAATNSSITFVPYGVTSDKEGDEYLKDGKIMYKIFDPALPV